MVFEISKRKGRSYKTSDPASAIEVYRNKNSLSMYHGDNVVRTKCIKGESSNRLTYQYLERS